MKIRKILSLLCVLAMAFILTESQQSENWIPKHLTPEEQRQANEPNVSSPPIRGTPQGDLESPYAPYSRPQPH